MPPLDMPPYMMEGVQPYLMMEGVPMQPYMTDGMQPYMADGVRYVVNDAQPYMNGMQPYMADGMQPYVMMNDAQPYINLTYDVPPHMPSYMPPLMGPLRPSSPTDYYQHGQGAPFTDHHGAYYGADPGPDRGAYAGGGGGADHGRGAGAGRGHGSPKKHGSGSVARHGGRGANGPALSQDARQPQWIRLRNDRLWRPRGPVHEHVIMLEEVPPRADCFDVAQALLPFGELESTDGVKLESFVSRKGVQLRVIHAFCRFVDTSSTKAALEAGWATVLGQLIKINPAFVRAERRIPSYETNNQPGKDRQRFGGKRWL